MKFSINSIFFLLNLHPSVAREIEDSLKSLDVAYNTSSYADIVEVVDLKNIKFVVKTYSITDSVAMHFLNAMPRLKSIWRRILYMNSIQRIESLEMLRDIVYSSGFSLPIAYGVASYGDSDERYGVYTVMVYLPGSILATQNCIPIDKAKKFVKSLAHVVEKMYSLGIHHTDLRADNIVVMEGDRLGVIDSDTVTIVSDRVYESPVRMGMLNHIYPEPRDRLTSEEFMAYGMLTTAFFIAASVEGPCRERDSRCCSRNFVEQWRATFDEVLGRELVDLYLSLFTSWRKLSVPMLVNMVKKHG